MPGMRVAVMGGGNASHTIAADLALKGLEVRLFEMSQFAGAMRTVFETGEIEISGVAGSGKGRLALVTTDVERAIEDVQVIFIPLPGFAVLPYARLLAPHLQDGQIVILMPGSLGALEFRKGIEDSNCHRDVLVAETGGLPFATRLISPGHVMTFHIRAVCALAAVPGRAVDMVYSKVKGLYPFLPKATVLETGLGHLTPLLHPAGVILNAGRVERSHGEFYMYEEGMTPGVVRVIESLDGERLAIGHKVGVALPTGVDMMVESGYGPRGTLWESINGSAGLTPVRGPDSLGSRYITEDVPYGLVAWASLGDAFGVDTPIMDSFIEIGGAIMAKNCRQDGRNLRRMGLEGLSAQQVMTYLEEGKRPERRRGSKQD